MNILPGILTFFKKSVYRIIRICMKYLEHITAATQHHTAIYLLSSRNNNNIYKLPCFTSSKVFYAIKGQYSEGREQNRNIWAPITEPPKIL